MKNTLFLFFALLGLSINAMSQDKGYIGLSGGYSIPYGDFGSTNAKESSSGFAKSGLLFDLHMGFKINENIGITAKLRAQVNPTDAQALAEGIIQESNLPIGTSFSLNSGFWTMSGAMIGGYGILKLQEKLFLEPKLLVGYLSATSPEIKIDFSSSQIPLILTQKEATASAISILMGANLRYNIGERFCLLGTIDYLTARPEFKNIEITNSIGPTETITFTQNFSTLNISVGFGIRF